MNTSALQDWQVANQRYLMAAVTVVRRRLENHIATEADTAGAERLTVAQQSMDSAASQLPGPSALEMVCAAFDLSPFERDVLLLCAGMELVAVFARLCADAQGEINRPYPTWSLALDVFPNNHWSALTPDAPLQYWRLIEVGNGIAFTTSPLRIDQRLLNYLVGVQHLDERLRGMVEPLPSVGELLPSQQEIVAQVSKLWSTIHKTSPPIIQLCGSDKTSKSAIALAACQSFNLNLNILSADLLPLNISELDTPIRLWEREALLSASVLYLDCHNCDRTDALRDRIVNYLISRFQGLLLISSRERRPNLHRPTVTFEVTNPDISEQQLLWHHALGTTATQLNGQLGTLISQFNLNAGTIHAVCAEVLGNCQGEQPAELSTALWNACRTQARPQMDDLAQRITTTATWDDLILPEAQHQILRNIAAHVRQRNTVYETWGFRSKSNRGLGISALFAGDSGTGKTLAAEVLARELQLDLYRIDLSQVVSKYIGETEKNLRLVFDAAENGGVVLLFDEADALFGKRSEVKDSPMIALPTLK